MDAAKTHGGLGELAPKDIFFRAHTSIVSIRTELIFKQSRTAYLFIKSVQCQNGTLTVNDQAICDCENNEKLPFVAECLRKLSARSQQYATAGGHNRQSGEGHELYQGTCVSTTVAQEGSLSLYLRLREGGCFEGNLSIFGLGGSGVVQGKIEGDLIRFQSNEPDRNVIDWNGKVKGDRLDGTYSRRRIAARARCRVGPPSTL